MNAEQRRLDEARRRTAHWKRWGPYLSERAWGTVREDYSPDGSAWDYFPHDHARSRAYRWNEDGLAGICDRHQRICFALALWNGRDPILKERPFGLSGREGNHGEDVKEYYFYLDSTPTHSYMRYLYKYPQQEYPYARLVEENRRRSRSEPEFELLDTGIFDDDRYWDIFVEYARAGVEDILIRIRAVNRGPEPATLHLLPTLWFRNTWAWDGRARRPGLEQAKGEGLPPALRGKSAAGFGVVALDEPYYGQRWLLCDGQPALLFTENETNRARLYGCANPVPYVKDGIERCVIHGELAAVNPDQSGTKVAAHYVLPVEPGATTEVRLRLTDGARPAGTTGRAWPFGGEFDCVFRQRQAEADEFYAGIIPAMLSADARRVMRQALAGMLWSKQFYHYVVRDWLRGDPAQPPPPPERRAGRNHQWPNLYNADVLSMPDKWEYPWYAAWDLAFHCVPLALVDPDFAKEQLLLMVREWYMHPNGQLPAYEWAFDDVNPPVHAWAAWRVYKIDRKRCGQGDRLFLERVFQKLLLNFTWWVNRKDAEGRNLFQGGFLGMDNIGVFDRSALLPTGVHLEQADATAWMAMYCLNMLAIAMELARDDAAYEDVASKFWEHFVHIGVALNNLGGEGIDMWNEEVGFYCDVLHLADGGHLPIQLRSMVGLVPLFAVETLDTAQLERLPGFHRRMEWFLNHRPELMDHLACMRSRGTEGRRLLALMGGSRLRRVLDVLLDEREFLSPYGIRSLSAIHRGQPYRLPASCGAGAVEYEPGESSTDLFGGNSNWRGPVWFPVNILLIEGLQRFHHYLGDDFKVPFPTGSDRMLTLWEVAAELSRRLTRLFLPDSDGRRPVAGPDEKLQSDPHWRELGLFHEYFHGDTGRGLGASHQTGWTGLIAKLLQQSGE